MKKQLKKLIQVMMALVLIATYSCSEETLNEIIEMSRKELLQNAQWDLEKQVIDGEIDNSLTSKAYKSYTILDASGSYIQGRDDDYSYEKTPCKWTLEGDTIVMSGNSGRRVITKLNKYNLVVTFVYGGREHENTYRRSDANIITAEKFKDIKWDMKATIINDDKVLDNHDKYISFKTGGKLVEGVSKTANSNETEIGTWQYYDGVITTHVGEKKQTITVRQVSKDQLVFRYTNGQIVKTEYYTKDSSQE